MKALALAAVIAPLAASAADFDRGVDVSAVLAEARAAAKAAPAPKSTPSYRPDGREWDVDCRDIRFSASETSDTLGAGLESHDVVYDYSPNGDGSYEQHGYGNGRAGGDRRRGSLTHYGGAAVTIAGRKPLLPWETDTFQVCLEGEVVDMRPGATAYDYKVLEAGSVENGWTWTVEPGAKRATKPDADGVKVLVDVRGNGAVVILDRWAQQYAGETLEVELEIRRDRARFFDEEIKTASVRYQSADEKTFALPAGLGLDGRVYVKYRFRRIGTTSTQGFTPWRRGGIAAVVAGA